MNVVVCLLLLSQAASVRIGLHKQFCYGVTNFQPSDTTNAFQHDPHWDMASLATNFKEFLTEECDSDKDACDADVVRECCREEGGSCAFSNVTRKCLFDGSAKCVKDRKACADENNKYFNENKHMPKEVKLHILTRPISNSARGAMASQQAVGKGLDIKPKSSKKYNSGYIPVIQACPDNRDDQTEGNDKKIYCKSTGRPVGVEEQNTKAKDLLLPSSQTPVPKGVDKRVCIGKNYKVDAHQTIVTDLFGYKAGTHILPVVSDYDILAIAECPPHPTDRLYMKQPYFTHLAEALRKYAVKKQHVMDHQDLKAFSDPTMGLMSNKMKLFLERAITIFARSHGAVRHGQEAENYAYPQDFDLSADHTIFLPEYTGKRFNEGDSGEKVPWEKKGGMKFIQNWYSNMLEEGCCVPINMMWLLTNENHGFGKEHWLEIYEKGKKLGKGDRLKDCPWWSEEGVFMKTMETLEHKFV